ncbi:MAG: tRNA dihydrouridine synthase DusB [Oscillospiraceae bacterium]
MEYIKIGNVKIKKTAALAPMAGVCDNAFRNVCKDFGASYMVSEMASAMAIFMSDKKSFKLLSTNIESKNQSPFAIQLFGNDPDIVSKAILKIYDFINKNNFLMPDIIDFNMGCPVPKIVGNGSGSALMKDFKLAEKIISVSKKTCETINIPFTVKFRKGWDDNTICCDEFAKIAQESGADAITLHPRTRNQMYSGKADWDCIKRVKEIVKIPVIGNGDIFTAFDAKKMYDYTNCDLVMVGRGSCGNPWIFKEIVEYFENGKILSPPILKEKLDVLKHHIKLLCEDKGEVIGMKEARKHTSWYIKNVKNAASIRGRSSSLKTYEDLIYLCDEIIKSN